MSQRIQRSRKKGWKKPEGAIIVSRPSKWGNPFVVGVAYGEDKPLYQTVQEAVQAHEYALAEFKRLMPSAFKEWIAPLRGHDLCCWCPTSEGSWCHADTLLRYANEEDNDE